MRTTATFLAFGRNDLVSIRRDSLLRMLIVAPFAYAALVRFPVPPLTELLDQRYGVDLVAYYPLIVSFFTVLGQAAILGALAGLLLLDEKDTATLHAVRVTPASLTGFAAYRVTTVIAAVTVYTVVSTSLSGLMAWSTLPGTAAAGLCAGLVAAGVALSMALIADNKVEGMAVVRALGLLLLGLPMLPYFIPTPWEWLFGLLPSYWPAKIYWVAAKGGTLWPYLLIGVAYNAAVLTLLLRGYSRRHFT
ncbi:hypothetical protein [Salinactinospora qingdaonensis]|uniref:Fluoroquinolones efflux ABC transporter permease n=1 Tax=Salinactinospora qingdaonensis TaxID=702744 RepID=A0ABP7GHL1_9ACTN